jgi:hypothetical protein
MPTTATDYLRDLRIDTIMEDLIDVRNIMPGNLLFYNRLKEVPADNRQLIAKHQGRVQIAPMIATNAKAPVFKADKFTVETNTLGKIKFGTHWAEDEMEDLIELINSPIRDPQGILAGGMVANVVKKQLMGIRMQQEFLSVAMALDGQFGTGAYSRFGFILEGVSWGRYTDLKRTVSIPWYANPTTATPVNDILTAKQYWVERYGRTATRITMATQSFRDMIATTEFQNKVRMYLAPNVSYINIPQVVSPQQRDLARSVLDGMEIVLYDSRFETQNDDLSWSRFRYMPLSPNAPVILDDKMDDKNADVQDFGMGTAMESRLASARENNGTVIGELPAGVTRPISYAVVPQDLDPVGLTVFSVAKCFPRLYQRDSNVVLNVGPTVDLVPSTDFSPV